jgi:hypothetical protein
MAHEQARKHLRAAAERQKDFYDAKLTLNRYNAGDLVWYISANKQLGITPNLRVPYE